MPEPLSPPGLAEYLATPAEAERQFRQLFRAEEPIVKFDIGAFEGKDFIN